MLLFLVFSLQIDFPRMLNYTLGEFELDGQGYETQILW